MSSTEPVAGTVIGTLASLEVFVSGFFFDKEKRAYGRGWRRGGAEM